MIPTTIARITDTSVNWTNAYGIRKLTPKECLMIQGFPADFDFPEGMANCHKYKQAGNSVSVPVVRRIAERMIEAMDHAEPL